MKFLKPLLIVSGLLSLLTFSILSYAAFVLVAEDKIIGGGVVKDMGPNPTVSVKIRHYLHFFDFFARSDECSRTV